MMSSAVLVGLGLGVVVSRPLVYVHYMPWYEAKPHREGWGWHWTMGVRDPDRESDGRREIASHYYPLAGPYDSGDEAVLEYHAQLMRVAGIDGAVFDWYGFEDLHDYRSIHENTVKATGVFESNGLGFALCFEDRTVKALIEAGRLEAGEAVSFGRKVLERVKREFWSRKGALHLDGKPVFLVFGPIHYSAEEMGKGWREREL